MIAAHLPEDGGALVGQTAEDVEILSLEANLNGRADRRTLFELLHEAARADDFRVQLRAQLHQQRRHVILLARVDQDLREIIGRCVRFDVVIETRRGPAAEDARC